MRDQGHPAESLLIALADLLTGRVKTEEGKKRIAELRDELSQRMEAYYRQSDEKEQPLDDKAQVGTGSAPES